MHFETRAGVLIDLTPYTFEGRLYRTDDTGAIVQTVTIATAKVTYEGFANRGLELTLTDEQTAALLVVNYESELWALADGNRYPIGAGKWQVNRRRLTT